MTGLCCPICTNKSFNRIFTVEDWSVYECTQCNLGITQPFPDDETRSALYDDYCFVSQDDVYSNVNSPAFKKKINLEKHRVRFVKKEIKTGHLLDVGCGSGFFLYAAKMGGFSVEGFDISGSNNDFIENKFKIPVTICPIEKMDFPENHFDIITMWHSLEHNPEPGRFIEKCLFWLKSEGVMVIEVPNHNCIDAKINPDAWPNWILPFHLYHFTKDSLSALAASCNLNIVATNTYLSEFIKESLEKKPLFKPFARTIARQFDGSGIAIACKKMLSGPST